MTLLRADPGTSGTTLPGAITGVFVMSLVIATGAGFIAQTARVAERAQEAALLSAEIVQFDRALINAFARVVQPLDSAEPAVDLGREHVAFGWYAAEPEAVLELRWGSEGAVLTSPQGVARFPRIAVNSAQLVGEPVWHLRITVAAPGGDRETELIIPVGQLPRP